MKPPAHEQGMALLTVLLLVAVMAVIAVAVLDDVRFAIRRTTNAEELAQARWYALGAEELARQEIARLTRSDARRTPIEPDWNGRPLEFPTETGSIRAVLRDGQACFNLNSVVAPGPAGLVARPEGARQFVALAQARDLPPARAASLAATLTDWIDSDDSPGRGGAEDGAYAADAPARRTAGVPLAEVSELRAIKGFDAATYRRLRSFVCALPVTDLSPINVNTLTEDQAPLLVMLTHGRLTLPAARRVIQSRPAGGWADTHAFWGEPLLAAASPSDEVYDQVTVTTRYFTLDSMVVHGGAEAEASALLEARAGGVRTVARRWTVDE